MTTQTEALKLALEAFRKIQKINWRDGLENLDKPTDFAERQAAIFAVGDAKIYALKAIEDIELTLAQPEQRHMLEQPIALKLASWLDTDAQSYEIKRESAAELRRLHELNQELLEALKFSVYEQFGDISARYPLSAWIIKAQSAIVKATGEPLPKRLGGKV